MEGEKTIVRGEEETHSEGKGETVTNRRKMCENRRKKMRKWRKKMKKGRKK